MAMMLPGRRGGAARCCCTRCARARSRLEFTPHVATTKVETVAVGHIVRKKIERKNLTTSSLSGLINKHINSFIKINNLV